MIQENRNQNLERKDRKRQEPACPVFKKCGGCRHLDLSYEKQVKKKEEQLRALLKPFCRTESFIGMEQPLHHRHKVNASFGRDRKGNVISGT